MDKIEKQQQKKIRQKELYELNKDSRLSYQREYYKQIPKHLKKQIPTHLKRQYTNKYSNGLINEEFEKNFNIKISYDNLTVEF